MAHSTTALHGQDPRPIPTVNSITLDHPWRWLAAGWQDLVSSPLVSLGYGLLFVAASYLLTAVVFAGELYFMLLPLAAGFFLLAPLLAVGLYEVSRRRERSEPVSLSLALGAWSRNPVNLMLLGLVLMMAFLCWMMVANLVFALFYSGTALTVDNFVAQLFLSGESPAFLFAGVISGGVIAALVFTISVISVPMLIDGDVDLGQALQTSVASVRDNPRPLLLWAALIVMFVVLGMVSFYLGFLLFMPLLGHASWHAYRDLTRAD